MRHYDKKLTPLERKSFILGALALLKLKTRITTSINNRLIFTYIKQEYSIRRTSEVSNRVDVK